MNYPHTNAMNAANATEYAKRLLSIYNVELSTSEHIRDLYYRVF
jgi:hypothetical protein